LSISQLNDDTISIKPYTNYPAFIVRKELRFFKTTADRFSKPISIIKLNKNGTELINFKAGQILS
jgi:hypothetical protein